MLNLTLPRSEMTGENAYQDLEFQDRNIYSIVNHNKDQISPAEDTLIKVTRKLLIWKIIALAAITLLIPVSAMGCFLLVKHAYCKPVCPQNILMDNKTNLQTLTIKGNYPQ
ncbi:uncharacterized protein O3C94_013203 [Discoglossus pictus]